MSNTLASRRGPGPVGQFQTLPVKTILRFLTIPYICAQRILHLAREVQAFHMTSMHIARQALHLVILLNDSVDATDGPKEEQQDERVDLGDDLIELEVAMRKWGTEAERQDAYDARIPDIKQQYAQFFKRRFYFHNARSPDSDPVFQKLLAYDNKTMKVGCSPQSINHPNDAEVQARVESGARIGEEEPIVSASISKQPLYQRDPEQTNLKVSDKQPSASSGGRRPVMNIRRDMEELMSSMKKSNTTNARAFRELRRRAEAITAHLNKSKDTAQQKELLGIFTAMADQFNGAAGGQLDTVSGRMDPRLYITRKKLIVDTDEKLNQFQAPPKGRSEVMRKATLDDANSLGIELDRLTAGPDGLLRAISEPIRNTATTPESKTSNDKWDSPQLSRDAKNTLPRAAKVDPIYIPGSARGMDSSHWGNDPPRSPSPEAEHTILKHSQWCPPNKMPFSQGSGSKISYQPLRTFQKEGSQTSDGGISQWVSQAKTAHEYLEKKLVAIKDVDLTPSLRIPISDMCFENGAVTPSHISLDQTFGELADIALNNDTDALFPDFWSRKIDHDQNRVTSSGVTWEWQDPSARVLDVITKKRKDGKKESLGIEKVTKEGEYVVALVERDKKEGPMPVDIPRAHRQSASKHFQKVVFPDDNVSKVLELQSGEDASEKTFDRRFFSPFTNPVFIEVRAGSHEGETGYSALGMDMGVKSSAFNPTTIVSGPTGRKEKQRMFGSKMAEEGMPSMAELQLLVTSAEGK